MPAAELEPLEREIHPAYPEQLRDVATVLFVALLDSQGLPLERLAVALTDAISDELGGHSWYMNKGTSYKAARTAAKIVREYTGDNLHLLARKYRLSEMRIRQIVGAAAAQRYAAVQRQLDLSSD